MAFIVLLFDEIYKFVKRSIKPQKIQKTKKGTNFYVWRMNQGKDLFYLLFLLIPFLVNKKKDLAKGFKKLVNKFEKLEHTISRKTE